MSGVYTYLPDEVKINFLSLPITGFADGDFVVVAPANAGWTRKVGADGIVTRTRSNDFTYDVEITLEQASPSNTALSAAQALDRASAGGKGPLTIVDLSGQTLHAYAEAWVVQNAESTFGKESGDRTWTINTGQSIPGSDIVGGNEAL